MRRVMNKTGVVVILIAILSMVFGCGDGNLLDESNLGYTASLAVIENDEATLQVDTERNPDCDGDPTTNDPEFFSDTLGEVTVTVDRANWGLVLDYYVISYTPLQSPDINGVNQWPPDLTDPASPGDYNYSIGSGESATFSITLMSTDTKAEYVSEVAATPTLGTSRYQITVTLYFSDEYGNEQTLTVSRTVYLSNYDRC